METSYGFCEQRKSSVIFVVPHGGDPDERMIAAVAERLRLLPVSWIVNNKVKRRTANFNKLSCLASSNLHAAKDFWRDLRKAVGSGLKGMDGAIRIFFIHNAGSRLMKNSLIFPRLNQASGKIEPFRPQAGEPRPYDIDIGIGHTGLCSADEATPENIEALAALFCEHLVPAASFFPKRGRDGKRTFEAEKVFQLIVAAKKIQPAWRVEVGREFAAQNPDNLSQATYRHYEKSGRVFTAQIEFIETLDAEAVSVFLSKIASL